MPVCLKCGEWAGDQKWRTLCPTHFREQKRAEEAAAVREIDRLRNENALLRLHGVNPITPARLRQLIQLCHPDKHNGSASSNEVTQWLLTMKGKK